MKWKNYYAEYEPPKFKKEPFQWFLVYVYYAYISKWFDIWWYKILFAKPARDTGWLKAIWCRLRNHPAGIVYYNPSGFEPNYHCKNCGDELD